MKPNGKKQSSSKLNHNDKRRSNDFVKFSGLAFELLGIITVGIGIGYFLDLTFENQIPFLTIIFSFLSLVGIIYYLLRRLPNN